MSRKKKAFSLQKCNDYFCLFCLELGLHLIYYSTDYISRMGPAKTQKHSEKSRALIHINWLVSPPTALVFSASQTSVSSTERYKS